MGCWFAVPLVLHGKPWPSEPPRHDACGSTDDCLKLVDAFLANQPRQDFMHGGVGLMQTFGPHSIGGGPCPMCELVEPCPNFQQTPHCRYDVYDNALAAIYLTKRGLLNDARKVLDAFTRLLYPPHALPGLTLGKKDGMPSGRDMALLAASYTEARASAGDYQGVGVSDGAADTGNNAWVGLAFSHFAATAKEPCYALVARDILHALKIRATCNGTLGGFASRFAPYPHFYRSTEHNIDM